MMTRKFKGIGLPYKIILSIFLIFSAAYSFVAAADWIVAAQKFELTRGQTDSVSNALSTIIPSRILDNFGTKNFRTIHKTEQNDREIYDLKKSQNSLFLQLSSEIKKRDSLVLGNYSQKELAAKIAEEDKKIEEIQTKIKENVERRKELEAEKQIKDGNDSTKNEQNKSLSDFFKKFFNSEEENPVIEKIVYYRNDSSSLFVPGTENAKKGYLSSGFEKEVVAANIKGLITGKITLYGEYMAVAVEVYTYPNAKLIAAVTEIGTIADADFICSSIASQLVPPFTNSLPVTLVFSVNPSNSNLYIDDVLQTEIPQKLVLESGVHSILVEADGYKNSGTSYFFNGNNIYHIEVNLAQNTPGTAVLAIPNILGGSLYANGNSYHKENDEPSQIKVNGENVLGQFITEDGLNAFVYIDKTSAFAGNLLSVQPKFVDRNVYIENRRRWMYTSYSALIVSLIPLFYTNGVRISYENTIAGGAQLDSKALAEADIWTTANTISIGVSIGIGCWFIYDLVRYFLAADSVLPYEAKSVSSINKDKKTVKDNNNELKNEDIKVEK